MTTCMAPTQPKAVRSATNGKGAAPASWCDLVVPRPCLASAGAGLALLLWNYLLLAPRALRHGINRTAPASVAWYEAVGGLDRCSIPLGPSYVTITGRPTQGKAVAATSNHVAIDYRFIAGPTRGLLRRCTAT